MAYQTSMQKLSRIKLFDTHPYNFPTLIQRINNSKKLGKNCIIAVDGRPRSGKSYFSKWLATQFPSEKSYTIFTLNELMSLLQKGVTDSFIIFDEIEIQTPSTAFQSSANVVLRSIVASYGYLHNELCITMPSILMIDKQLRGLITYRVTMDCRDFDNNRQYRAFVKIPHWLEHKNKYVWDLVEIYTLPFIPSDEEYEKSKHENFIRSLGLWQTKLSNSDNKMMMDSLRLEQKRVLIDRHKLKLEKQRRELNKLDQPTA